MQNIQIQCASNGWIVVEPPSGPQPPMPPGTQPAPKVSVFSERSELDAYLAELLDQYSDAPEE